jgi:dienelactone hydrolase
MICRLQAVFLALVLAVTGPAARCGAAADPPPSPPGVAEEPVRLAVTIRGKAYALEALVVRQSGAGKLPVALITHGGNPGAPRDATLDWLRGWAHDMAHRGWLAVAVMRRGYGGSDGEVVENSGNCDHPNVSRYFDAHADDLEAALRSIARRPDADISRVLAIGDSTGGAVVLALAARPSAHIAAAVNVSGGLSQRPGPFRDASGCAAFDSDLVWSFARFGATSRVPTLWLYAENDGWFRPGLVARMHAAYTGSGGWNTGAKAELVMLPPFGNDGHAMFYANWGRQLLLPELDRFLRAHELPTWNQAAFAPLLSSLSPADRDSVENYLRQPAEKVLTLAAKGGAYWHMGETQIADARSKALEFCKQKNAGDCKVVAENFDLLYQAVPSTAAGQ